MPCTLCLLNSFESFTPYGKINCCSGCAKRLTRLLWHGQHSEARARGYHKVFRKMHLVVGCLVRQVRKRLTCCYVTTASRTYDTFVRLECSTMIPEMFLVEVYLCSTVAIQLAYSFWLHLSCIGQTRGWCALPRCCNRVGLDVT